MPAILSVLLCFAAGCLRPSTKQTIRAAANRSAAAISTWDVHYEAVWVQAATVMNGQDIPEIRQAAKVHEINEPPYVCIENPDSVQATDGQVVYAMTGDSGMLMRFKKDQFRNESFLSYRDALLTKAPRQTASRDESPNPLPDLLSLINDPAMELLDEPVIVNGRACRVLQKKSTDSTVGLERDVTVRLALDPPLGWMPVRLTNDVWAHVPNFPTKDTRWSEMLVEKATRTPQGTWVPQDVKLTIFRDNEHVHTVNRLRASNVSVNQHHPPSQFVLTFPPGCHVYDGIRGIGYIVGEKQELIDERLAKRAEDNKFFAGMLGKPAPPLQPQRWLAGQPITLEELKGRRVILHFWNIWCGPCVHEIPQLQQSYGRQDERGPVFISIHAGGDERDLPQIESFLKQQGVSFPVLLDAADPQQESWGLTCKAYGIDSIPTNAEIDAQGRLIVVKDHRVAE